MIGDFPLENIEVTIQIKDLDGQESTEKFAIGNPALSGIDKVDGSGSMAPKSSGIVQWLMIPRREAAPIVDVAYQA